jgi:NADH-quinone oxidoreductase subunit L
VSAVVQRFSRQYMQGERRFAYFFALLGITTSLLLWLSSSPNLLMLFAYWHGLSWLLYLLLAYNERSRAAQRAARKTLIIHLIGDVAFVGGLVLAWQHLGTLEFRALTEQAAQAARLTLGGGVVTLDPAALIAGLLLVSAMAKSAQFLFHLWLPVTMDTPTPVSALMHAGIVNAGGFLLNRLAPLYTLTPDILHLTFLVGAVTLVLGAGMMLVQSDIKRTLGYSTMAQMGYMIMECGLGAFALAIFHLMAHGLFKATHFLNAGQVIHKARLEPRQPPIRVPARLEFSAVTWGSGLLLTLILPLAILLAAHGLIQIPLMDSQGEIIFLFFSWVTASQVTFSLYRLNPGASWKVVGTMAVALLLIVLTYLWLGMRFTAFLYPDPDLVMRFFEAAALPAGFFDLFVVAAVATIVTGWLLLYAGAHNMRLLPRWLSELEPVAYMALANGLYLDALAGRVMEGLRKWSSLGMRSPARTKAFEEGE